MKKLLVLGILILFVSAVFALESDPSEVVGYVKYGNDSAGYIATAFSMDDGTLVNASDLGDLVATVSTVSQWIGTTWQTATKLPPPIGWSGNYALTAGFPYMINSTAAADVYITGEVPSQISYSFTAGQYTFMMLRMDRSDLTMASALGDEIGVCNTISKWTGSTWQTATKLPPPIGWSGDFSIGIGEPLMVNATGDGTWPTVIRTTNSNQSQKSKNKK